MDFVAIDFETASNSASSACQLAAVHVAKGEIVDEACWLIRPPRMYFSPRNISIHGIRPDQVRDAPTMEQLWGELSQRFDGQVIVAHNARFDINVLIHSLAAFEIACPALEFHCTRTLARSAWPGRNRYGLKPLGNSLGIAFKHHDALEDARCCALIAIEIGKACDIDSVEALEKTLKVKRGVYQSGRIVSPRAAGRRRGKQGRSEMGGARSSTDRWGFPNRPIASDTPAGILPEAIVAASADSLPLAGRNIVLLGALRGLDVAQSKQLIERLGGTCQSNISPETHYVIACGTTLDKASQVVCESLAASDSTPSTSMPAEQSSPVGGIRLLSERQFRALLPGGKAGAWQS